MSQDLRDVCTCGHAYGKHIIDGGCDNCDCEKFVNTGLKEQVQKPKNVPDASCFFTLKFGEVLQCSDCDRKLENERVKVILDKGTATFQCAVCSEKAEKEEA